MKKTRDIQLFTEVDVVSKRIYVCLYNGTSEVLENMRLCFTVISTVGLHNFHGAQVHTQFASFLACERIANASLAPYASWNFSWCCQAAYQMSHDNDLPAAPYLLYGDNQQTHVELVGSRFIDENMMMHNYVSYPHAEYFYVSDKNRDICLQDAVPIIPKPLQVELSEAMINCHNGFSPTELSVDAHAAVLAYQELYGDMAFIREGSLLQLTMHIDDDVPIAHDATQKNQQSASHAGDERYIVHVTTAGAEIRACSVAGLLYGLISLHQLVSARVECVACCTISDAPRFSWRGFMLDTVRQFYELDELRRIIRLCAMHKINIFHWHITDDEAWRVELQAYPELAEKWGYRGHGEAIMPLFGSGIERYGGVYTQKDIVELQQYARQFGITVMLELDIPGHSYALMNALPQLQEADDASEYASVQGYTNNTLNPGLDATYEFLETVIGELCALSEGPYFHYGCDERPEFAWHKSPACAALMQRENLADYNAVQTYFVHKVEAMIRAHGKQCGAWEEASVHGDIDKNTIIFSWQGIEAGIAAASHGHPVVMCPGQYYYFDMAHSPYHDDVGASWAGYASIYDTYRYDPYHNGTDGVHTIKDEHNIIGVQANLWSESLWRKCRLDYMLYPRFAAFAEGAWTAADHKDYHDFCMRVQTGYLPLLEQLDVGCRHG